MPSSPSTKVIAQSGRLGSSCRAKRCWATSLSCRQLPGRGRLMCSMWAWRSKWGSSTQYGRPRCIGTWTMRRRKMCEVCSLERTRSR